MGSAVPDITPQGLRLGDAGVSYASFSATSDAERMREGLATVQSRWKVAYAELEGEGDGPPMPMSVSSTATIVVDGLQLIPDFLEAGEAQCILDEIDKRPWDSSIKRRVQHYGRAFDYASLKLASDASTIGPFPSFLSDVVQRIDTA